MLFTLITFPKIASNIKEKIVGFHVSVRANILLSSHKLNSPAVNMNSKPRINIILVVHHN